MVGTKHIFVTGGVVSSLGKGITAAALGRLLKNRGYKVSINKLDPYINVDPGTMNPYQHGEVFVTDDGVETDLDIGHYERFIDESLTRANNTTSGQVYSNVLQRELEGGYEGRTVQTIPHVTNEILAAIQKVVEASHPDILITEIGGTIGDIESLPFLEAVRHLHRSLKAQDCVFIHVSLLPYVASAGEVKTKPTQHSVRELNAIGLQPDIIVCRCQVPLTEDVRKKVALFCNIEPQDVIENTNLETLYQVPLMLEENGLARSVCRKLGLREEAPDLSEWEQIVENFLHPDKEVTIAIVGKYIELHDAYLSIVEALQHGGIANKTRVKIRWIQAQDITEETQKELLQDVNGILVPGGFGERGMEGKILAAQYARENKIPFLGICLGMQVAVIEFARHVLGFSDAHSTEMNPQTTHPVIALMEEQNGIPNMGGTQRLGKYDCHITPNSLAHRIYGQTDISERHRHRYEFNNQYSEDFSQAGMAITGRNLARNLGEIVEIPAHPWYIGVQFHPELKSRPNRPHPLFRGLVAAALEQKQGGIINE